MKLRGISLDDAAAKLLHFETMKQQVLSCSAAQPIYLSTRQFQLSKHGTIDTVYGQKKYIPRNQKSIVLADGTAVPFGYNPTRP